jgi:small subunit ribosomal protein S21
MIKIKVNPGENIDRALKRFKRKFDQTGVVKELRGRMQFEKPSAKKRKAKLKAIYIQDIKDFENI